MNSRLYSFHLFLAILVAAAAAPAAAKTHSISTLQARALLGNDPSNISGQYCTLSYLSFPPMCPAL